MPGPFFNPDPEATDRVLHDLSQPNLSLLEVAEAHETSVQALTLFMARPDIAERLDTIDSAVSRRARHIAANHLGFGARTLATILEEYTDEALNTPVAPNTAAREQRRHARETARKAVSLLLRIAHYHPRTAPPIASPRSAPPAAPAAQSALPTKPNSVPLPIPHSAPSLDDIQNLINQIESAFPDDPDPSPVPSQPPPPTPAELPTPSAPPSSSLSSSSYSSSSSSSFSSSQISDLKSEISSNSHTPIAASPSPSPSSSSSQISDQKSEIPSGPHAPIAASPSQIPSPPKPPFISPPITLLTRPSPHALAGPAP